MDQPSSDPWPPPEPGLRAGVGGEVFHPEPGETDADFARRMFALARRRHEPLAIINLSAEGLHGLKH